MFKGKIRKCLKCGEVPGLPGSYTDGIFCEKCDITTVWKTGYKAVNYWNQQNIPPDETTFILHYYARFNMRLP